MLGFMIPRTNGEENSEVKHESVYLIPSIEHLLIL
jgi:hypothetical protein